MSKKKSDEPANNSFNDNSSNDNSSNDYNPLDANPLNTNQFDELTEPINSYNQNQQEPGRLMTCALTVALDEEEEILSLETKEPVDIHIDSESIKEKIAQDLFELIQYCGENFKKRSDQITVEAVKDCLRDNNKEFKNNTVINNISEQSLKDLTNAYIKMDEPKPNNYQEFSTRSENMPGIMECIKQCIEKISEVFKKVFVLSERAKISKDTNNILEHSSINKSAEKILKKQQTSFIIY